MAASKSELWTQFLQLIKIIDETWKFGADNTPNYLGMEETLQEAYVGNHVGATNQIVNNLRGTMSNLVDSGRSLVTPVLRELARVGYNSTASTVTQALKDIRQGMVDGTETVRYRNHTFGAISAGGSNNGDGTVLRLTVDKDGEELEGGAANAGVTKIEITADYLGGRSMGNEQATVYGGGQVPVDQLDVGTCPGETLSLTVNRPQDPGLLTNANFATSSGSGASLEFSGWTLSDAEDFEAETSTTFQGIQNIEFIDNDNFLQHISSATLDPNRPVFAAVWFQRVSSCDGDLTLRLGTQTETVSLSAQTGWNLLTLGDGTSTKGWYENFQEDYNGNGLRVQVTLASRTTGSLIIGGVIVAQPVLFDGKFYLALSGDTNFLRDDYFTFTDSVVNTGRTQYWLARLFGEYFPQATSGETYADA